ncbi:hypothetical protein ILYODFUR_031403 [Ilyodon furcidens]|uniref:Secreted protein n=1 Tax=Ilyodon furcidens TaxID=33524 RepID=A0ABV0UPE6_9TELE
MNNDIARCIIIPLLHPLSCALVLCGASLSSHSPPAGCNWQAPQLYLIRIIRRCLRGAGISESDGRFFCSHSAVMRPGLADSFMRDSVTHLTFASLLPDPATSIGFLPRWLVLLRLEDFLEDLSSGLCS